MALRRPIRFAALLRSVACLQRAEPELSPTRTAGLTVAPPPPPAAAASAWRPPVNLLPYRAFAAPAQVKKKQNTPGEDDNTGPRVNNAITAPFVRLVTDEGHDVIPRHEALQLAARLNLDLVEVQRKADPPVCKIMDFHKEKYKKEVKEKERLKTKSALVLRGRENKEVRFKGKTELKDLKVKADAITRLMERGYRVKCTAMPSGSEEEDLGGLLSRLLGLIQDVCIVESGPHLDTRHAYFIVRHAKFATKKSGKKASKAMENVGKGALGVSSETPVAASDSGDETPLQDEEWEQAESDSDVNDRAISDHVGKKSTHFRTGSSTEREGQNRGFGREFNLLKYKAGNNHDSLHNFATGGSRVNSGQGESQISGPVGSIKAKPGMEMQKNNLDTPAVEMNRYAARRQQTREDNSQSSSQGRLPQDPRRNENEGRFQMGNNQRPFQQHNWPSQPPNDGQFSQGRSPQDRRRNENERHIPLNNNQKPFQPLNQSSLPPSGGGNNATAPTTKSFGMFSTPKSANCTEQGSTNYAGSSKVANPDLPKTYGVSSSKISSDDNKSLGNKTADGPINNSSTTQKFGIFGTKRAGASNNQN